MTPYHGKPKNEKDEVVRGKPKSGTTWFHAHATAYTILSGRSVRSDEYIEHVRKEHPGSR